MVNRETGLRAYEYTAEGVFLEPYFLGQAQAQRSLLSLGTQAQGSEYQAAVADVERQVADWSAWAQARKSAVDRDGRMVDLVAEEDGKARFDRFRAADDRLAALATTRLDDATSAATASRDRLWLAVLLGGPPVVLSLLALGALLTFSVLRPLGRLAAVADRLAAGESQVVPGTERPDEVGSLARALERWKVAEAIRSERELLIRELSTPPLPIKAGLLLVPIIGTLDSARAEQFTQQVLEAIRRHRARVIVIDLTGVPVVDSTVANHLLRSVEMFRLMGAVTS